MIATTKSTQIPPTELKKFQAGVSPSFSIRKLGINDISEILRLGLADFKAMPTHLFFIAAIYPVCAFFLANLSISYNLLPYFFPMLSGFALLGPFAAIGLYEISRRRDMGLEMSWNDIFGVLNAPGRGAMLVVAFILFLIFAAWMVAAHWIYGAIMGSYTPESITGFLNTLLTTKAGWALIIIGHGVGFAFAALAFTISVVSFPLLLDKPVSATEAIRASVMTVRTNPVVMTCWAATIAVALMLGSALLFIWCCRYSPMQAGICIAAWWRGSK